MLEILFPRHGAVLNHNHGKESASGLSIEVCGECDGIGELTVNGVAARRCGRRFTAEVTLKEQFTTITAELSGTAGRAVSEVKVVWDKASFKRYNFFVDDHIFFLTDLARERPAKAFDHFYLAFWKKMHTLYGTKVTLNCFYRNDHDEKKFTLSEMPECYKGEFEENSDWLKLAFHAYSEFPDRPYQNVSGEKLGEDYELVQREIERFAGPATFKEATVLHWAMARPSGIAALAAHGVKVLEGQYTNSNTGLADQAEKEVFCDVGYFMPLEESIYLRDHRVWYDFRVPMTYIRGTAVLNLVPMAEIPARIIGATDEDTTGQDIVNLASHEQYSFPRYFNYLPDHLERLELAIKMMTERGYKPVFFHDGFLGNDAWGA